MNRNSRPATLWLALLGALHFASGSLCATGVLLWYWQDRAWYWQDRAPAAPVVVTPRGELAPAEQATVELFRNAAPAVVYITKLAVRADPFRRNFLEIPEGTGSGFVWDDRGHFVTNFHVIEGAGGARVTLADQSTWPVQLVGYVAESDIAVLRIDCPRELLHALPVGTSHDLEVGQHVFAIGNPFGLDHTLSTGV